MRHLPTLAPALLALAASCGGGSTAPVGPAPAEDGGTTIDEGLSTSKTVAAPGESLVLTHAGIGAGEEVTVEVSIAGQQLELPYTAYANGRVTVALPPLFDAESGAPLNGDATLRLAGSQESVEVTLAEMPKLAASVRPGDIALVVIEESLAGYADVRQNLATLASAEGIDVTEAERELDDTTGRLEDLRDEIELSGGLTFGSTEGHTVRLFGDDLLLLDRVCASALAGLVDGAEADETLAGFTRNVDPLELDTAQVRELIRSLQVLTGRNLRNDELDQALANLALGAAGVPSNAAGAFFTALGAAASGTEIVVGLRGSQVTMVLTSDMLNGERLEAEARAEAVGNFGKVLLGVGVLVGWWWQLPVLGTMATVASLSVTVAEFNMSVRYTTDMKLHIPMHQVEFSEVRVLQPGAFHFPTIGMSFDDHSDPEKRANAYNLSFYGIQTIQGTEFFNPGLWGAFSIRRQIDEAKYGAEFLGEHNTAAGIDGGPPVPAPDLGQMRMFGIFASGVRDDDLGNPSNSVNPRGKIDVKYTDGPVVFTFRIEESTIDLYGPADPLTSSAFDITATIGNGSSLPVAVYGLEFEFKPGDAAFDPLYESDTPLVVAAPGEEITWEMKDLRIDGPTSWEGQSAAPRLIIQNGSAPFASLEQQFWSRMRSAPALSGNVAIE